VKLLASANGLVAAVLFAALTVVVALQVLTRFVLHVPMIWSEEAARFLFFWVVLLGAAMSVRTRRHFAIDVTMGRERAWGPRKRLALELIPDLVVLGFSILLLVQGVGYARVGLHRVATNSQVNMAVVYGAIPVFAALSIVYSAGNLVRAAAAFRSGEDVEPRPPPGGE
jgi:TRAP-type C4-dicarboxylate transport system permease small subunit